jgi:hypothetical protein
MTRAHLTAISRNKKTGPIPVSITESDTCWDGCPFKDHGCYAEGGPLAIHWGKVDSGERGVSWAEFCAQVWALPKGTLWRYAQAGDLPGEGEEIDAAELQELTSANRGRKGFGYTHKPMTPANREAVANANAQGFTINLSANNLAHADELSELGIAPVAVVLPADTTAHHLETPAGRRVITCPATYRENVTCKTCGACAEGSAERHIIGFPAHGTRKRKASTIAAA